ncbi:MAG: hypothetical protein HDR32_07560 [Treponema sp.]|nr:hypothetical protein [Treponema sp.]
MNINKPLKFIVMLTYITCSFPLLSCWHKDPVFDYDIRNGQCIENLLYFFNSGDSLSDYGYCDWKDWQDEAGKRLHPYLPKGIGLDEYEGMYKLILQGQSINIFFDDERRTAMKLFHFFVEEYAGTGFITLPQENENRFVFSGWAKNANCMNCTDENQANISYEIIQEDSSYKYGNFKLIIADAEIINEVFMIMKKEELLKRSFKIPAFIRKNNNYQHYIFQSEDCHYYLSTFGNNNSESYGFDCPSVMNWRTEQLPCYTNQFLYLYGSMKLEQEADNFALFTLSGATDRMPHLLKITCADNKIYYFDWYQKSVNSNPMWHEVLHGY